MEQKIDLFTAIHKAIRALLYEMGRQLQVADLADQQEMQHLLSRLEHSVELLQEHGYHEDHLIFPPIEKVAPGSTDEAESQHRGYEEKVTHLLQAITQIRQTADATGRLALTGNLNRAYTNFMSFYLTHMNCEEESLLELSKEKLSNDELQAIRLSIQKSIPPQRYMEWLQWMLPSLHIHELVPLFRGVKVSAPTSMYEQFKQIGQRTIEEKRWHTLCELAQVS